MTQYTVWLWPGFGVELKPFTVEAFSEQDALETVGQSLKGSALTLDPDEFFEKVQELEIDGYSEDEAVEQLYQEWFPVNGGEFYLNILNARIEQVPEASANRRASRNRSVMPYGGGYVSLPGSYNAKQRKAKRKGIFGSRNVRFAEDLPKSVCEAFPLYIPSNTITMPSGEVMDVVGEVNLLDGQTDGEVSCYVQVIDADGEWWDVAFTFTLDYFVRTPKEKLDWSGHISDVLHNPDMSPSMNRKSTGKRRR